MDTSGYQFNVINEQNYGYSILTTYKISSPIFNLFDRTGTDINNCVLNYDISMNVLYIKMNASGPLTTTYDISYNLIINNLFI